MVNPPGRYNIYRYITPNLRAKYLKQTLIGLKGESNSTIDFSTSLSKIDTRLKNHKETIRAP
jgi:hypothetical protein